VWSDGCGGVLNLQLGAGSGYGTTQREYYTHLSWIGWKLLYLEQQETALTLFKFEWPYNQEYSQRAWKRNEMTHLNLYVSNVSQHSCAIHVGRVEVLNQTLTGWTGKLHIDGTEVSPPSLPSGHYLECTDIRSTTGCRVFDARGNVVAGATHVETHASSSAHSIGVTVQATGRAELVIMEANESRTWPYE
jgi:hypothetical protein